MNNKTIIVAALFVLVAGGLGAFVLLSGDASTKKTTINDDAVVQEDQSSVVVSDKAMVKKEGRYVPFSPEVLANTSNSRRVLFFYANWCPTCRPANESFSGNEADIPDDVTLIRVNYNDTETDQAEKELSNKYGVTYQHTFVQIDGNGDVVTKWNGGQIDELLRNIK